MHEAPGLLLVDDEPMLLQLLQTIFSREGYRVFACSSGRAAVDLYRHECQHIGLVLLDVCMPELDGPQTLAELRRINAGVGACFMSGYTGTYTGEWLESNGALRLFEKPFQISLLLEEVRQLFRAQRQRQAA